MYDLTEMWYQNIILGLITEEQHKEAKRLYKEKIQSVLNSNKTMSTLAFLHYFTVEELETYLREELKDLN